MQDIKKLSLVIPVYKKVKILSKLIAELNKNLIPLSINYELIFIVDGCPCGSLSILRKHAQSDNKIRIISLKTNLGQNWALLIGFTQAKGDILVVMDADLQDPPESIPLLLESINEETAVLFAGRRGRYESLFNLATSKLIKNLLYILSYGRIPADAGLFFAMKKEMVNKLFKCYTDEPYIISLMGKTGLKLKSIPVTRNTTLNTPSTYNLLKRLHLGWLALSNLLSPQIARPGRRKRQTIQDRIHFDFAPLIEVDSHLKK